MVRFFEEGFGFAVGDSLLVVDAPICSPNPFGFVSRARKPAGISAAAAASTLTKSLRSTTRKQYHD
jgi:hypothetical protein